jgi:hypothetical protein
MYLALRPPWGGHATTRSDAGVVAEVVTPDAGVAKAKKKRHHRNPGGPTVGGDEQGWGGSDYIELSAADRVLEWRGDDTTRPPQKLDMANGAESRSLDDGEIRSTIDGQSGPAQSCVVTSAQNTNLSGTITVKLVVDGSGHVIKSKLQAFHYMFEHGLLACMQRAVRGMKFPATGSSTLVTMPVNFT